MQYESSGKYRQYEMQSPTPVLLRMRVGTVPKWQCLTSEHLAVKLLGITTCIRDRDGGRRRKAKESSGAQKVCRPKNLCMRRRYGRRPLRSLEQLKWAMISLNLNASSPA